MTDRIDESLLSQLADGELDSDRANDVLLDVLDTPALCERLKTQLRLRRGLAPWRTQEPARPVVALQAPISKHRPGVGSWRLGSLAAAAMIGGALVLAGSWITGRGGRPPAMDRPHVVPVVSPQTRREVAGAFALHESVAGPLKWYAADDRKIQVAAARDVEASGNPVAILLRLAPTGSVARSYVVVCRNGQYADVDLPASDGAGGLHLRMLPTVRNGRVNVHYAVAMDNSQGSGRAVLAGQRTVGLEHTPLGQLVYNEQRFDLGASAWVIHNGG